MGNNEYIFTLEIAVRDYEIDSEGIVNNAAKMCTTLINYMNMYIKTVEKRSNIV